MKRPRTVSDWIGVAVALAAMEFAKRAIQERKR